MVLFALGDPEEIYLPEETEKNDRSLQQYYGIYPVSLQWRQGWIQEMHSRFKGKSKQNAESVTIRVFNILWITR